MERWILEGKKEVKKFQMRLPQDFKVCLSCLLLCNKSPQILWLKIISLSDIPVSMSQELEHSLAGSPTEGPTKLQSGIRTALSSRVLMEEEFISKSTWLVDRIHFLWLCRWGLVFLQVVTGTTFCLRGCP